MIQLQQIKKKKKWKATILLQLSKQRGTLLAMESPLWPGIINYATAGKENEF